MWGIMFNIGSYQSQKQIPPKCPEEAALRSFQTCAQIWRIDEEDISLFFPE